MRTSQPVIRYELNDIILDNKTCLCGLKTTAIKRIEGRSDDILCFEDKNKKIVKIFPDFIRRAIITSNEEINNLGKSIGTGCKQNHSFRLTANN